MQFRRATVYIHSGEIITPSGRFQGFGFEVIVDLLSNRLAIVVFYQLFMLPSERLRYLNGILSQICSSKTTGMVARGIPFFLTSLLLSRANPSSDVLDTCKLEYCS